MHNFYFIQFCLSLWGVDKGLGNFGLGWDWGWVWPWDFARVWGDPLVVI